MKKKGINLLLFSLITLYATAQTDGYKFFSPLDSIKTSGFYTVELTPELNAHLKTDYSDLRIVNGSGKWIPHILYNPSEQMAVDAVSYDLRFTKTEMPKLTTILIIENTFNTISNVGLVITNTEAERFCTLSGSNDQKNWFVINDSILINPVPSSKATENTFTINFPPSNYHFFKLVINNKNKDPFNIKAIVQSSGAYIVPYDKFRKTENFPTSVLQKDSGNISYIKVTQQEPFHFDNISLQVSGVKYFYRKCELFVPNGADHSFSSPGHLVQSFTVSNNSTLRFKFPLIKSKVFYLLIDNEDNLPLTVNGVKTYCSSHYITAYLENGNNYKLILDNELAGLPNYDLSKLDNKIPDSTYTLQPGRPVPALENKIPEAKVSDNKLILWASIAAALIILLFFTKKMLGEVDKRKTS